MHIVFLVHSFPIRGKTTGGAANYVANMAKIFSDKGHLVEIITESEIEEKFYWNDIIIHKIRATRGFRNNGRKMPVYKKLCKNIWRSYWYNKKVLEIDRDKKVDIVQCVNTYGLALFRRKNIPYIVRLSDYPALWSGANREDFDFDKCTASKRIDEEFQFIALKRADLLLSPSFLLQKLVANRIGINPRVIESPVMIVNSNDLKLKEVFESNHYFLTFSELNYRKEVHIIAKIIDRLLDDYPNMKYVICGRDKEIFYDSKYILVSEMFKLNIKKNVDRFVFLGEVSDRSRMFSIIKHANVCILPTRVDNFPNASLEAMALGKIVISTTSKQGTSMEQLIRDGYNGFLAEVDNVESLCQKIGTVMRLSDKEKREIAGKAKDRVKNLSSDEVYENMIKLYENTISHFAKKRKEIN